MTLYISFCQVDYLMLCDSYVAVTECPQAGAGRPVPLPCATSRSGSACVRLYDRRRVVDPLHIDLTAGTVDAADLALEARRLLSELDREVPGASALNAECRPPLDVVETATSIEVVVDVPGATRRARPPA